MNSITSLPGQVLNSVFPKNPTTGRRFFHPFCLSSSEGENFDPLSKFEKPAEFDRYENMVQEIGKRLVETNNLEGLGLKFKVVYMPFGKSEFIAAELRPNQVVEINYNIIVRLEHCRNESCGLPPLTLENKVAAILAHEVAHGAAHHHCNIIQALFLALIPLAMMAAFVAVHDDSHFHTIYSLSATQLCVCFGLIGVLEVTKEIIKDQSWINCLLRIQRTVGSVSLLASTPFGVGITFHLMGNWCQMKEHEANRYGMHFSKASGYDPRGLIWFFSYEKKLRNGQKFVYGPDRLFQLFSTNPTDEEMIAECQKTLKELNA